MTEIKNYSQWSAENALGKDPIDALREYTDYARLQYLRSGVPMNTVEPELRAGVEDKLKSEGLLNESTTPEQLNELQTRLFAPKSNADFDAAVVQNYLALDAPDEDTEGNSTLLRDYLAKKKYSPELAAPLKGAVDELLKDNALVRKARLAAVNRGDFEAVSVTEDDGSRSVYSGARDLSDEELPMVAETLVRAGAVDALDLPSLQSNYRKVLGGKSTANRAMRAAMFDNALSELSKQDPEIADVLAGAASAAAKEDALAREGIGSKAASLAVGVLAAPLAAAGEVAGATMGLRGAPTGAETAEYQIRQGDRTAAELIRERLLANPAMRKSFTDEEIETFTGDTVLRQTDYQFDNSKPESGLRELSTGEVQIAPALLARPQELENALGKSALNDEQKEFARAQRGALLDQRVPQMLKLIASSSDEAASAYAAAKQTGTSDREFVEQWLSDNNNYSSFGNRAASFGFALGRAVADIPLGIAALAGSETATKIMLESQAKQARFSEYGAMFGDETGLAGEALNALPQVAVDLALTIGTAGAGRAATAAARAGAMTARTAFKTAFGALDDTARAAVQGAVGSGAQTSSALQAVGRNLITKAAEEVLPVALPAFTRSASNTYVSVYGSLPEDMTHAEKHKQSLGFALAAGVGTAAITAGLSALGAGGIEKLGVRTAAKGVDDLTYREAKVLFEAVENEGKAVSDTAFRQALAAEVSGNYKRLIGGAAGGFRDEAFEEALDQSINMAIEDAALKRNRPVAEKLQQIWNAALVGGVLGGGITTASQAFTPTASARTKALQQRVSVLDGIAKRLSTSNAPQTAASVQRMMDDANAAAAASVKQDTVAAATQAAAATTTAVRTIEEGNELGFDDPRGVPPVDTRIADLVGERVYIDGTSINGIAEVDANTGEVVINFSKPTKVKGKPNVTRYVLGRKYQKATGLSLQPKVKTLAKPVGALPAGTRVFSVNKMEFVLPTVEAVDKARAAGEPLLVLQRDEKQRVVGITVRGVALAKNPSVTTDTTITDPDLMREVLRLYPAPATPTGGFQLESGEQLELDFNAPSEPAPPTPAGGFALEPADQLELDFNASSEPELQQLLDDPTQLELDFDAEAPESTKTNLNALAVILAGDPVLGFLRTADPKRNGFTASVQKISDGEWSAAGDALEAAFDFVADLGDTEPLLTKAALDTLGPIRFKYDTGTTIRNRSAKQAATESARRDQGAPAPSPAPEAEAPPVTPAPAPAPTPEPSPALPAAKKAARKAAKTEPAAEAGMQVLTDAEQLEVMALFANIDNRLNKGQILGGYNGNLSQVTPAREIRRLLAAKGYKESDTPKAWVDAASIDKGSPRDIEKLNALREWAFSGGKPAPETATAEPQAPVPTRDEIEDWLNEGSNAQTLVGATMLDKRGNEFKIEEVRIDEGDELEFVTDDPATATVPLTVDNLIEETDPESFTQYLEAGNAEPEAGAVEPEPAAESEFDRAKNAADKMRDLLKVELKTEYPRLSELALEPKAKRAKVLAKIREFLLEARVSPFSRGFFLYGTEDVESAARITKQLYDEAAPDEDIKKQKADVLKRVREKVEQAIVEARTDERTAQSRKQVEEYIGKKVTSYTSLTPANLVAFGPSGMGFVNLDKEAQELRGLDPNRSKKYFADRLAKAEDFNSEWRTFTLDVSKEVEELNKQAPAPEPSTPPADPKFRKALSAYVESVDDAKTNYASPARAKSLAKKGLDAGFIDQQTHNEAVREANDKGMDPDDRAQSAFDTLLGEAQDRLDTLDQQAGTLSMLAPQGDNTLRQNITDIPAALRGMLPAGFTLVADPNMDGALGYNAVTAPTTVFYNPNLVGSITIGLARADALATLRTAVDHELGHAAAEAEFGQDGYAALAAELGEDMLTNIASIYYSLLEPDFNLRAERVKADRESGALPDWKIAAEWVRMEIERIANGRTSEQRMLFLRSRPSLLAKFIDALNAFVTRLRARFFEQPTTGTAASISNAARQLRKLRNGGHLPAAPKADPNLLGHAAEIFGALERGSDQTLFTLPIGAAAPSKKAEIEGFWGRLSKRFENLPPYLRDNKEERDGIMSVGNDLIRNFTARFSKLSRDFPQLSLDDMRTVLGRTDPALDDAALAKIQTELDAFTGKLPADMDYAESELLIQAEHDRLQQRERLASNNAFREEQKEAEQRIRNSGAGAIADLLVKFRKDIDGMSARFSDLSPAIDDNMGVYLTRTYRFFNTDGWASLAAGGVLPDGSQLGMFRGKEIDFAKLRDNAARTYEQDAIAEAAKNGVVLTEEQLRDRTHGMLDKYLKALQNSAESFSSPTQDSLRKDLKKMLPKKNLNKELMDLLGVVEDPLENAVRTMVSVTKIAANDTFLRKTRETLLSMGLASSKPVEGMGTRAMFGKEGTLSPLSDIYTTPEVAKALQAEWGDNGRNIEKNTDSLLREGGRALMKAASFATTSKTLLSFGFYPRNIVSGQALLLGAQGILPINRYTKEAWATARSAYFESAERTPEQEAMIQRLIELQVLKDDTQGRVAVDLMRGFVSDSGQELDSLLEEFQESLNGNAGPLKERLKKAGVGYEKTLDFLASINNWSDGAVKTQAYLYELDTLKKDNADALARDPSLLAKLELRAADKVKATMPSHSRQLPIVRSLNQTAVGMVVFPFARWKTEVFRTMYNTPRLAIKEIREGGPVEKARGYKRLSGFLTTLVFGGSALGAAYAAIFRAFGAALGEDDEKGKTRELTSNELYALRESLPTWQKGHALYTRLVGGQVQVIDMTAITPYAQLTDLFVIINEGITNKESDWNTKRAAGYIAQQLIGTQIAATALNEVLNNQDDFGQPIYRETDNVVEVFGKVLGHYANGAAKPAVVDQFLRATRSGEKDRWEIVVGEIIGARPRNHKLSEIEYRAFRGVKKMLDDSAQIKSSLVTGRKIDEDEVVQTLQEHQESLNRTQRKLSKVMTGLESLGSTRGGIYGSGKNAGFSSQRLEFAEKGENLRWLPNETWLRGVYQNMTRTGEDDPMNRIKLIRRTLSDMPAIYGVAE